MKLFFKHLARAIVKKPLQPIILVFTLTMAIAVTIFSLAMRKGLEEEVRLSQSARYGNAQITVGLNGSLDSRFMFAEDAETVLDGDAVAAGIFELPLAMGEERKTVFGVACEFTEIGKIFDFTFTEYGTVTPSMLGYAAFVTQAFAEENGLSLGDDFTVTAFGSEKAYQVCGIARHSFMDGYDVMVDITGVVRLLTDGSPLFSALGDAFKPGSTIYVRLLGDASVSDCIEKLQADERFAGKTVTDVSKALRVKTNVDSLSYIIDVSALLAALIAASVTFCCFYIIASERTEENYAFTLSGAKPWTLRLLQYAEITAYWVVAAVLGCLLAMPLTGALFALVGFRYASSTLTLWQMTLGAGVMLLVSLATVTTFIGTQMVKRKNSVENQVENRVVLWALLCVTALSIFTFLAPMGIRFWVYITLVLAMCFFLFVAMPALIKRLTKKINALSEKRFFTTYRLRRTPLRYAVKNIFSVKILHNISRLVALLTCILLTSSLLIVASFGNTQATYLFFNGDYVVVNATESCAEKVSQCESVQDSVRIFLGETDSARIASADSVSVFSKTLKMERLPQGNQAFLASGWAKQHALKVGDGFTLTIDGREVELIVAEIIQSGMSIVLFDCEHFGIPYNMMVLSGADGVSQGALLQDVTDKIALELATVIPLESLFEDKLVTVHICLKLGVAFLVTVAVFACVGMLDNLYESYRARRDEFGLYACSGMSKKEIRRMKGWEIVWTFGCGIALGVIGFVVMSFACNACFHAFGFETFLNVGVFFHR